MKKFDSKKIPFGVGSPRCESLSGGRVRVITEFLTGPPRRMVVYTMDQRGLSAVLTEGREVRLLGTAELPPPALFDRVFALHYNHRKDESLAGEDSGE